MSEQRNKERRDGERIPVQVARDYDFPRASVFSMFTDPKKAATFWGPEGAVVLVFELDPRPGGAIRIIDRHGDGTVATTAGTITDIVVPDRLVFRTATTLGKETPPFEALQAVTFEEPGPGRTRVAASVKVLAAGAFPGGVESLEGGFLGGWGQTLDRLQRELR
jgi:uncharacterized protein YndB with AHSA1/START domain